MEVKEREMEQILKDLGIDYFPEGVELNWRELNLKETLRQLIDKCEGKKWRYKEKEINNFIKLLKEELKKALSKRG